jgi:hypothetical protein
MKLRKWLEHVNDHMSVDEDEMDALLDKLDICVASESQDFKVLSTYVGSNGSLTVDVQGV